MAKIEDQLFSDIYFTPENIAYVHDGETRYGLKELYADDLPEFRKALDEGYNGRSSYSLSFGNTMYRVERVATLTGIHYSARRMPRKTPDVARLGLPENLTNHLISLNRESGLLLWGFPELALAVPRPGRWLEGARKIMCGLMLAAAGWLLWSAAAQISDRALLRLCLYPVLLIVLLLLKKNALLAVANMRNAGDERKDIERFIRWGAALLALGLISGAAADMNRQFQENPQRQAVSAVDFEKLRKKADDGRVVFVKIDAAWSVASRFNRYTVFNSPMVHNIFDGGKVELIEADMTVYNRKTAEFMKHFGRYSAPLYVIFSPQLPDGLVLPDLLTE